MTRIRLLPLVVVAISLLLVLKTLGLVFHGGYVLTGVRPAQAQTPAPATQGQPATPDGQAAADGATKAAQDESGERQGRIVNPGSGATGAKAAVLERLGERRKALDARERELDMRDVLLKAAEKRLEARIGELKDIEARIEAAVRKREAEKKAQLKGLVTMYENMKPKDAARLFSELNINVLVDLVEQMNARKMADILANMDGRAAERLTLAIAARGREKAFPTVAEAEALPKIEGQKTE